MTDYFKIVAVIKKRGSQSSVDYSYVPHKWELGGVLYWPQANLRSLRLDPASQPKSDWKTYNCKVKKNNIFGPDEAELWEEEYVKEGTDAEDKHSTSFSLQPVKNKVSKEATSYDMCFDKIVSSQTTQPGVLYIEPVDKIIEPSSRDQPMELNCLLEDSDITTECNTMQAENATYLETLFEKLEKNLAKLSVNQTEIMENQERIYSELIQQKLTNDKLYQLLREIQHNETKSNPIRAASPQKNENLNKYAFPLSTVDNVIAFNKDIGINVEYKNYLVKRYITIGGREGTEEGKVVAKKLCTAIFTDHVLTLFSWTGVSRTPGLEKKEVFQSCEEILSLFLEIVQLADSRWNTTKNEKFFKYNTLKHAKQTEKSHINKKKPDEKQKNEKKEERTTEESIVKLVNGVEAAGDCSDLRLNSTSETEIYLSNQSVATENM